MPTLNELRSQSGTLCFVSFFGKSSVPPESPDYQLVERIAQHVIERGAGVIHGGYALGMMEAVSNGARYSIDKKSLPPQRNIGIPQKDHDHWPRVKTALFSDICTDSLDRLRLVTQGNIGVVCPIGGDGTFTELAYVFGENAIRSRKKPLVIIETPTGTQWSRIIQSMVTTLNHEEKTIAEYSWLYITHSYEETVSTIDALIAQENTFSTTQ